MARQSDEGLEFSRDEVGALKTIVRDWINEELSAPPYDEATAAVLRKLGLGPAEAPRRAAPHAERPDVTPGPTPLRPNLG